MTSRINLAGDLAARMPARLLLGLRIGLVTGVALASMASVSGGTATPAAADVQRAVAAPAVAAPVHTGPVGWDVYRQLDRLPELGIGTSARQFSSYDRHGFNDDGFSNHFSCLSVTSAGCLLAENDGAGQITSMWFTRDGGNVSATGNLRVELDDRVVLDAPLQSVVDGALGAPFVFPLVANAGQSSGGVYVEVPMPYTRSMRVYTTVGPDFYHVDYRVFADATGVRTFDPTDRATDVIAMLRGAGTADPKPPMPGADTVSNSSSIAPGAVATLADLPGPGVVSALRLTPNGVSQAPAPAPRQAGSGSLQLPLDPANSGVRVTVRTPAGGEVQRNPVLIDGQSAAKFADPQPAGPAVVQSLDLPAVVTAGKPAVSLANLVLSVGATVSAVPAGAGTATSVTVAPAQALAALSSPPPPSGGFPRELRLRISFDGQQTVDSPVDEFFGSGLGDYAVSSLMSALNPGGEHVSWWPMPYTRGAHVELYNASAASVSVSSAVTYAPSAAAAAGLAGGGDAGYFSASSAAGTTTPGQDWPFLDTGGTGKVVGVTQTVHGTEHGLRYLEGDERAAADGARTPQVNGTGTEDFYHAGWYFSGGPFSLPTNGMTAHQVRTVGCVDECMSMYRLLLAAALPFSSAQRFGIEHGKINDVSATYGSTTLWYGRRDSSARVTGSVDVGVPASEAAAGFSVNGVAPVIALMSTFEGPDVRTPIQDEGRAGTEVATFRLSVDPANEGVTLRRMSDQRGGAQAAAVTVDGQPAGVWRQPSTNSQQRWLDDDFSLSPSLTTGKSTVVVAVAPLAGSPPWSAARYTAVSLVPFFADTVAPTMSAVRGSYDPSDGVLLSWRPAVDDSPAVRYRIYEGSRYVGETTSTGYADRTAPLGTTLHYTVVPVDPVGNVGAPSADATVATGTGVLAEAEWGMNAPEEVLGVQDMTGFGPQWSGGAQAFLTAGGPGQRMDFDVTVPTTATYAMSGWLTQAADYGTVAASVDGTAIGPAFDGYAPGVQRAGPVPFGFVRLGAGRHQVTLTVVGRDPRSTGFFAGLDALQLDDVGDVDPIVRRHDELGGDAGLLGAATGGEQVQALSIVQAYGRGMIVWTPDAGAHEVHGAILGRYLAMGGPAGLLGPPSTDETGTPDGIGRYNHFHAGSAYWTPTTGAHDVHGAIRDLWASLGWERSALGYPVTDETGTPDGLGRFNHFQAGSAYWSPSTGAHEVRGAIRDTWASLGWERSALGYPTTNETGTPDGVGRFNGFQGGAVYWTPPTGAHEVRGAIRDLWASLGWERSALGYPVTDEFAVAGGRQSNFERGSISWTAATGAVRVSY